jgi:hypothetical protein
MDDEKYAIACDRAKSRIGEMFPEWNHFAEISKEVGIFFVRDWSMKDTVPWSN